MCVSFMTAKKTSWFVKFLFVFYVFIVVNVNKNLVYTFVVFLSLSFLCNYIREV